VTARLVTMLLALSVGVTLSGCATLKDHRVGYASWEHFTFSMKSNWQHFVGWRPVATPDEARLADREGGWWGDDVDVWTDEKPRSQR
jgi:hypothetical protein